MTFVLGKSILTLRTVVYFSKEDTLKIYSKFHDYYDSVLKFSQDDDCVYMREPKEYRFDENMAEIKSSGTIRYYMNEELFFIGFCGKIYPVFQHIFDDKLENFHIGIDNEILIEKIKNCHTDKRIYRYDNLSSPCLERLLGLETEKYNWFKNRKFTNPFTLEDFFLKYEIPVFVFKNFIDGQKRKWVLETNPCLKDYDFQRIFDPYSAFQEIYMFFNSVLTNVKTPKMPVGSDKVIAESKGFDKWSFRKIGENSK